MVDVTVVDDDGWLQDPWNLDLPQTLRRLADAEAAIMNCQASLGPYCREWWILDDYGDGSMDAIRTVVLKVFMMHGQITQDAVMASPELAAELVDGYIDRLFPRDRQGWSRPT